MFSYTHPGFIITIFALSIPIVAILAGVYKDIMRERYKNQQAAITDSERDQLEKLVNTAKSMEERIATLESILDSEVPDWREDYERN